MDAFLKEFEIFITFEFFSANRIYRSQSPSAIPTTWWTGSASCEPEEPNACLAFVNN
jgi:hypothetical protein